MKIKLIIAVLLLITAMAYPLKMAVDAVYAEDGESQTGNSDSDKESYAASSVQTVNGRKFINNLAPNEYTPESYIVPQYDPFNNQYRTEPYYKEEYPSLKQPNAKPDAKFVVRTKTRGFADSNTGTVGTVFIFSAGNSTDSETSNSRLQARWDFESDGNWDTYFSKTKTARHAYDKPGTYTVTLEVLDKGGAVSSLSKKIIIVKNTPPSAYLTVKDDTATEGTIFEFDTSKSTDSQYLKAYLKYRFDWENDGIWDTKYENKTGWKHRFSESGNYRVVMEAQDPEGLVSTYYRDISVTVNNPPQARFTIEKTERKVYGETKAYYTFDASSSTDTESPKKLRYRWDFNYTGPDDIVFDTPFSGTAKHNGSYNLSGTKTIRLQVMDEDGAIDESYAQIAVN